MSSLSMGQFRNMSIKNKILFLTFTVAALVVFTSLFFTVKNIKDNLMRANEEKIASIAEITDNILKSYDLEVKQGVLTKPQAQALAIKDIEKIKYEGANYVWINDYNGKMLVHPSLKGKESYDLTDKKGSRFIEKGIQAARSKGSVFIDYTWSKPDEPPTNLYPKLSIFKDFSPWGWIIATGIYIDEINQAVLTASLQILISNIIVLVIVMFLAIVTIIKDIVESMGFITRDLASSSNQVYSASSQLEMASVKLAEGTTEQAASIQETSSTLEETSSMVHQNNENTKQAAYLAQQSTQSAEKSNIEMQSMMNAMEELKRSSGEISKIIKVIDEIAFQTNILSLNAAVEAARAGDAGKGFAVVAEEVRSLAQRSAQAAKDTTNIIESNISLSENSADMARNVYKSISEIDEQTKKVSELLNEISVATNEQSLGVEQINKAIAQMEIVMSSNAQTAEESASASRSLTDQTTNMNEIIQRLQVLVDGQKESIGTVYNAARTISGSTGSSVKYIARNNNDFGDF